MSAIHPVILCGGSGTRLWPLSREAFPKQFVPLLNVEGGVSSLFEATLARVKLLGNPITCLANQEHRFLVRDAIDKAGVSGTLLLEPEGRNTAAAMAAAALRYDPEALLLFLPADQYIPDAQSFVETVRMGTAVAEDGWIVTFGVAPDHPATGYGYIQRGESMGQAYVVARFTEKPDRETAERFLASGNYFWNAGIFLVKAKALLTVLESHAPDILNQCRKAVASSTTDGTFVHLGKEPFLACRTESIDYAVMEKHDRVAVVPLECRWSDVGNWNALIALIDPDDAGNRTDGNAYVFGTRNTYVYAPSRPVVVVGVNDIVVVDTPDAVLVSSTDQAEQVKQVVATMKDQGAEQVAQHRHVARPWGWYDCLEQGPCFQVKRIGVNPGARLSLQMHNKRSEHWVVVKGAGRVTNGDRVFDLHVNESTYIPAGTRHRLENLGPEPLEIIEVQTGSYFGEDDIIRFEDSYGRTEQ